MAFIISMVKFVCVYLVVFHTCCSLESKSDDLDDNSLDVPLIDSMVAPIKAQLDLSKLTKQLRTLISKSVQKEVKEAVVHLVESLVENKTKEVEEDLKTKFDKQMKKEKEANKALVQLVESLVENKTKEVEENLKTELHKKTTITKTSEPRECSDVLFDKNGSYVIHPNSKTSTKVYCLKDKDAVWTVIQRNHGSSSDFAKTWNEYKVGFGSVQGDHWLGNENIHLITSHGRHKLRVLLTDREGTQFYADYSTFTVDDEKKHYRLTVTGYSGTAGDSMDKVADIGRPNGKQFTTKDSDNDNRSGNCASYLQGGWWHNNCEYSDLNGHFRWLFNVGDLSQSLMMITKY